RLEEVIGEIPHTPLARAVAEAMQDIGIAVAPMRQAA
ncbi:MAG: oxidoreductase, partial [Mesorhizobium sp.]